MMTKQERIEEFKNKFSDLLNEYGAEVSFDCGDKIMGSFHTVGEVYNNYYDILTESYTYLKDSWSNMDDRYISDACKNQTNRLTSEDIGALQAAYDCLQDGSEQQQIIAFYLQKAIKKLSIK